MSKIDENRAKLEEIKQLRKGEIPLGPIEKWMIQELEVERLPSKKTKGSIIKYRHKAFENPDNVEGNFVIHKLHKKREMIRLQNLHYLVQRIETILNYMEQEERSEG